MMTLSRDGAKILSPWAESDRSLIQGDDHRGGGRVMKLSESDKLYISVQIHRYNSFTSAFKASQKTRQRASLLAYRENCLWRIASCSELLGDALDPGGALTDDQWNQVLEFIEQFQANN
ncbi:hypothetical protein H6F90_02940 [Trichocoleus sp. FACHB-591]|uniref:hypothetical protein n=1 Tax=Trichocoleus sp. FACHB-591 TaxID=2692872 RepID=UPI0016899E8D|nr:hypothetical protein [Trichocoleus sp. FACHB-591]MBD2094107.1 hypothetical protein [Trichocoleus sp. FACHB-591]